MGSNKKLRIVFLGIGSSKHIQRLGMNLSKHGHEIFFISADKYRPFPNDLGITFRTFDSTVSVAARIAQIRKILGEIKPDVLHSHFMNYGGFIGVATGFHPHLASQWGCDILNVPKESRAHWIATKLALRATDWLLPVSNELLEESLRLSFGHDHYEIVNWGVDTDHFSPDKSGADFRARNGLDADAQIIFSPRVLDSLYNQHVMIEAFSKIHKEVHKARLVISRYGAVREYEDRLRRRVEELGLEGEVKWIDEISLAELPGAYNASDVVVSIPRTDGTPMTVLEAMSCGRPVVVCDVPSLLEWVKDGENGYVAPSHDSDSVGDCIKKLLVAPHDEKKKISQSNRREILKRASLEVCLGQLERIYVKAVETQKPGFSWTKTAKNIFGCW